MNKIIKLIFVLIIITLAACSNSNVINENDGKFIGCYYFVENGDGYDLVTEVHYKTFLIENVKVINQDELSNILFSFKNTQVKDSIETDPWKLYEECASEKYTSETIHREGANISEDYIEVATNLIRNFEFEISYTNNETNKKEVYRGKLDLIEN